MSVARIRDARSDPVMHARVGGDVWKDLSRNELRIRKDCFYTAGLRVMASEGSQQDPWIYLYIYWDVHPLKVCYHPSKPAPWRAWLRCKKGPNTQGFTFGRRNVFSLVMVKRQGGVKVNISLKTGEYPATSVKKLLCSEHPGRSTFPEGPLCTYRGVQSSSRNVGNWWPYSNRHGSVFN